MRISLSCIMEMWCCRKSEADQGIRKNRIVIRALYPKKQEFRELLETQCQELLHIYEEKDGGFIIELQPNVNKRDVLTRMLELEVDLEAFQLYEASLTDIFVSKAGDEE